ncbi:MAG: HAMP domain-containing sensor histidine kinase [bacterium]|nr:HAMP domain-containing sensor histidine kinase [bacterium]
MFQKTRIKLTAWYLLIIMLVSILFSVVIYSGINRELGRFERSQELRLKRDRAPLREFEPKMISSARARLTLTLFLVNVGIFGIAGLAGYFLAGRTLNPIKEMVEEQNRFITDASHELRTPLTSLKTSIEVNLRNKNMTLIQAKKLIKSNLEDVEYLRVLTDGLIHLAQYQKPNGSMVFQKISVKKIVDDAISKINAIALESKIKIRAKIEDIEIRGNEKSLVELMIILLDNAIKYSPQNSQVEIIAKKIGDKVVVSVSDEGIGIDSKDRAHIFDRFYRVEKSRSKKNVSGYGLGLSIAKKIVEIHKGSISLKSEKDKGTKFTIII